jgi:hypothetical protein
MVREICSLVRSLLLIGFFGSAILNANPFTIDFPAKEDVSNEEYLLIQEQLRKIDISLLVKNLYVSDGTYALFGDFLSRSSRGLRQTFINPQKGQFPIRKLEQIGSKTDRCIVTCVPHDGIYPDLVKRLPEILRKVGFDGFFLYHIGGFPNPTGEEIQYAGVPYCFKIFMMLEAYKLGFNEVLWIDSAAYPLTDPAPLFDWIEKYEILLLQKKFTERGSFILPATRQLLKGLTDTDVAISSNTPYICMAVFGLKMNSPRVQELIKTYYSFVKLGTPFLSCFPEEFVMTAIMGQKPFQARPSHAFKLLKGFQGVDNASKIKRVKKEGYYFYHLKH